MVHLVSGKLVCFKENNRILRTETCSNYKN